MPVGRVQKWRRGSGSRPMARNPNWGNRLSGGTSRQSQWLLKHVHPNPAQPVAGWTDVFQGLQLSTALPINKECRRLGGAFASGLLGLWPRPSGRCFATLSRFARLEPLVSNRSLSAIFDCGFEASQPCLFSRLGLCSSPWQGGGWEGVLQQTQWFMWEIPHPNPPLNRGGSKTNPSETARSKCQ